MYVNQMAVMGAGVVRGKTLPHGEARGYYPSGSGSSLKMGGQNFGLMDDRRFATAGTAKGRAGVGAGSGAPSGSTGYYPRENVYIFYARM